MNIDWRHLKAQALSITNGEANTRARTRRLSSTDAHFMIDLIQAAMHKAYAIAAALDVQPSELVLTVEMDGGAVARKYKGQAVSTSLCWRSAHPDHITGGRVPARRVPGGDSGMSRAYIDLAPEHRERFRKGGDLTAMGQYHAGRLTIA